MKTGPGHVDKYRREIPNSGLGRVVNAEAWGTETARERYGAPRISAEMNNPRDYSEPQELGDRCNLRGPNWQDDHPNDWVRGAGGDATNRPGYVPGYRPKGKS